MPKKLFRVIWSDWRVSLSIGSKTLLAFLAIIAVLAGGFYYYTRFSFTAHVEKEAVYDIRSHAHGAWRLFYTKLDQMKYGMLQAASADWVVEALKKNDSAYLGTLLGRYASVRPYVDYWAVVDEHGRVMARRNANRGEVLDINDALAKALSTGEPVLSTESVGRSFLGRESVELASRVEASGLMQFAVVPVMDRGKAVGAFITGMLLNGNTSIPGSIHEYLEVKSAIFMVEPGSKARVVASTGLPHAIFSAKTRLPDDIAVSVSRGESFFGKTELGGENVFVAIEPIVNGKGEVVGALAVAEHAQVAADHVGEISSKILIVAGVGVLFSLLLAAFIYKDTSRPVRALRAALDETASGNLDVEVDIRTKDEFEDIGRGFNRMVESIRVREASLDGFNQLSEILIQFNDPDILFEKALSKIMELTGSQVGVIYACDEASGTLVPAASAGVSDGEIKKLARGEGLAGRCIRDNKTVLLNGDAGPDVSIEAGVLKVRPAGLAWFPMSCKGSPRGVLMLGSVEPYDADRVRHAERLTTQLSIAVDNALVHREVARLSVTDPLTGVFNRRRFMEAIENEFKAAARYGYSLGVIMLDVDDFKSINDTFGHQQGDAVLSELSRVIKEKTRSTDVWARYGGEEFVGLATHTPADGMHILAEKIRSAVEERRFPGLKGRRVTVSVGVGVFPADGVKDLQDLMKIADDNLYKAKGSGKNMVVVNSADKLRVVSERG